MRRVFTRKVCTCNALLQPSWMTDAVPPSSERSVGGDVSPDPHDEHVFGVVLLNSPVNDKWGFEEFIRLHGQLRGTKKRTTAEAPQFSFSATEGGPERSGTARPSYFICADGAYTSLQEYCVDQKRPYSASDLCDVVIGDMDSFCASSLHGPGGCFPDSAEGAGGLCTTSSIQQGDQPPHFYASVASIPTHVLDAIRRRTGEGADAFTSASPRPMPCTGILAETVDSSSSSKASSIVLPIRCQMNTDFQKAMQLLRRLHQMETAVTDPTEEVKKADYHGCLSGSVHQHTRPFTSRNTAPSGETTDSDLAGGSNVYGGARISHDKGVASLLEHFHASACADAAKIAGDSQAEEVDRVTTLLHDVMDRNSGTATAEKDASHCPPPFHPSSSSFLSSETYLRTVALPNVIALGALGGRIDHEMSVMSCVLQNAQHFHLVVLDEANMLFACWPDGVTQWLLPWPTTTASSSSPPPSVPALTCGVIPFGTVVELETTGLTWNIVCGRPHRYDGVTGTATLRFAFDAMLSTSNIVASSLVTIDLRPLSHVATPSLPFRSPDNLSTNVDATTTTPPEVLAEHDRHPTNPPTLFTVSRPPTPWLFSASSASPSLHGTDISRSN